MVIALYAPVGSGKSTVLKIFASHGWTAIDQDLLVHGLLQGHSAELASLFGDGILEHSLVSRKKLGSLVFSDPAKLQALEDFLYPIIHSQTRRLIKGDTIIEGANLYKALGEYPIDKTLTLTLPLALLKERLLKRGHSPGWIAKVLEAQRGLFKAQALAGLTLDNGGSLEQLQKQTESLILTLH